MKILHLSNTNLLWDYRIQREMTAVKNFDGDTKVFGVGINFDEGAAHQKIDLDIQNLNLLSAKLPRIRFFRLFRAGLVFFEFILRACIAIHRIRPDVVHCHDTPALLPTRICRTFLSYKIIYDAHELMMHKAGNTKITSTVFFIIEKLAWHKVDGFITVGAAIRDWYFDKYSTKAINAVIYNSPTPAAEDVGVFAKNYIHDKYGLEDNAKVFAFVGQFSKGRGIEKILKTFSKMKINHHVVFLGYGELADEIHAHELKYETIHYHPAIEHKHVVDFLKTCDYGLCLIEDVSLSDRLCLPNKLFEYMQASLPVVASNLPEIEMVVNRLKIGILVDQDATDINDAILKLVKKPSKHEEHNMVDYLWPAQVLKLRILYNAICK